MATPVVGTGDIHRIGGGNIENLRLQPREAKLNPPGISVLRAQSPSEAARQIRETFPDADGLYEAAKIVGSTPQRKSGALDSISSQIRHEDCQTIIESSILMGRLVLLMRT